MSQPNHSTFRYLSAHELAFELDAKPQGSSWVASCPCHDDTNPSLSIREGDDGRCLVHCHALHDQKRLLAALAQQGLAPSSGTQATRPKVGGDNGKVRTPVPQLTREPEYTGDGESKGWTQDAPCPGCGTLYDFDTRSGCSGYSLADGKHFGCSEIPHGKPGPTGCFRHRWAGCTCPVPHKVTLPSPEADGFISAGELIDEPDEEYEWLVEGMLPASGSSFVCGFPKTGKTVFLLNLCFCVSHGEPFLGRTTQQGIVLYLGLEEKRREVKKKLRALGQRRDEHYLKAYIAPAPEKAREWLERNVARYEPVLIAIDTFQRLTHVRDMNDYSKVSAALEPLHDLARTSGAHLTMGHHSGKSGSFLGSTALLGGVDAMVEITRKEAYRTIKSTQRYGDDLEECVLAIDESYRLSLGGTRRDADEQAMARDILDFLMSASDPLERDSITAQVEGRQAVKVRALRRLVDTGHVQRTGEGRRGNPFLYSCTHIYPGTTVQETDFARQDAKNTCTGGIAPEGPFGHFAGTGKPGFETHPGVKETMTLLADTVRDTESLVHVMMPLPETQDHDWQDARSMLMTAAMDADLYGVAFLLDEPQLVMEAIAYTTRDVPRQWYHGIYDAVLDTLNADHTQYVERSLARDPDVGEYGERLEVQVWQVPA